MARKTGTVVPRKRAKGQPKNNAAAQTAARAAQIFGVPATIFSGRARVTTTGLQRGVSEMIRRIYAVVPGVAPMDTRAPQIKLTYIGQNACARYDWGRDAKKRLSVAGVINLPACGESDALVPRVIADQYTGYALHEMSHFLFTPLHGFSQAIYDAAALHNVSQDFAKSIINALEDVAIERDLIRSGYAPGAGAMLRGLLEKCIADVPREAYGTVKAFPVTLAFALRGYTPAAQALVDALPPPLREIYDAAARRMAALAPREIGDATSIEPVVAIANDILAALAALRTRIPPPDNGGDGEPGNPDPDGEPGDGEGDDGEGDDGEPGDGEPGDDGEGDDNDDGEPGDGEGDADDGDDTDSMGTADDARKPTAPLPPSPPQPDAVQPDPVAPDPLADDDKQPGEHEPTTDAGNDEPPPLDTDSLTRGEPITGDMQPEQAGEPGDGASGLDNDDIVVRTAFNSLDSYAVAVADSVTRALAGSARVAHALRTLLDTSARDSREGGRKSGRLDTSAFARIATGAESVFEKRSFRDGADAAVSILIDQSSSMNMDNRYHAARTLAGTLSKLISGCAGVKVEILGFHSGGGGGYAGTMFDSFAGSLCTNDDNELRNSMRGSCTISVYKTFRESHAAAMRRLGSCYGTGGTPDAASITYAAKRLLAEPAGQHVLIMIADGEGSPDAVLSRIIRRITRDGIVPIAIGVLQDMNGAFPHRVRVDDVRKLNESGLAALLRVLAQGDVAAAMRAGSD